MSVSYVTFRCCQHWHKKKWPLWPINKKIWAGTMQSVFILLCLLELEYVTMKLWESVFHFQTQRNMPMLCSTLHAPLSPSSSGIDIYSAVPIWVITVIMHNDLSLIYLDSSQITVLKIYCLVWYCDTADHLILLLLFKQFMLSDLVISQLFIYWEGHFRTSKS